MVFLGVVQQPASLFHLLVELQFILNDPFLEIVSCHDVGSEYLLDGVLMPFEIPFDETGALKGLF